MGTNTADVTVVGAGAIGCAIAYFLIKAGLKVAIVEKDSIASHASGSAAGILNPTAFSQEDLDIMLPLTWRSFKMHESLAQELQEETGIDHYFSRSASMVLAFSEHQAAELKLTAELNRKQGLQVSWLDQKAVLGAEDRISRHTTGAALCEDSGKVESYRYVLALVQAAEKRGVEIHNGEVIGLISEGDKVMGVRTASKEILSECVVLAMGPWASTASPWLGLTVPVGPEKGQTLRQRGRRSDYRPRDRL
jgi:glycine oxidase